jgi:hypothetical protein
MKIKIEIELDTDREKDMALIEKLTNAVDVLNGVYDRDDFEGDGAVGINAAGQASRSSSKFKPQGKR